MGKVLVTIVDEKLSDLEKAATLKDIKTATYIKILALERWEQVKDSLNLSEIELHEKITSKAKQTHTKKDALNTDEINVNADRQDLDI